VSLDVTEDMYLSIIYTYIYIHTWMSIYAYKWDQRYVGTYTFVQVSL
jgi:hypothetical protein